MRDEFAFMQGRLRCVKIIAIAGLVGGILARCNESFAAEKVVPAVYHRTAFLGDSITDGDTYPQLVRAALSAAGLSPMVAINAGIGGDTAQGMRARLDRDVLAFHPTLVTISAGANDSGRVSPADYEHDIRAIVDRLKKEHIAIVLLLPNIVGPKFASKQKDLDAYEAILRKIAREHGLRVVEVGARQRQAAIAGQVQLAPDDLHPNWDGQKMIARAVLDALGYENVKIPDAIPNNFLPGTITPWKMKLIAAKAPPPSDATIKELKIDNSWESRTLPEVDRRFGLDSNDRWLDGYRAQGASIALLRYPGNYLGVATIHCDRPKRVQFHTGGDLNKVWLNGTLIYENIAIRGYHIGRESVAADLKSGDNTIVIQTGPVFFLSVTDGPMWEETK
jgi:lysophospholipase L1-like esterase